MDSLALITYLTKFQGTFISQKWLCCQEEETTNRAGSLDLRSFAAGNNSHNFTEATMAHNISIHPWNWVSWLNTSCKYLCFIPSTLGWAESSDWDVLEMKWGLRGGESEWRIKRLLAVDTGRDHDRSIRPLAPSTWIEFGGGGGEGRRQGLLHRQFDTLSRTELRLGPWQKGGPIMSQISLLHFYTFMIGF